MKESSVALYAVSDRSGWWNVYRSSDNGDEPVCPRAAEFGEMPAWDLAPAQRPWRNVLRRAGQSI